MFFLTEMDIFRLYERIQSGELIEDNLNYHKEIIDAMKEDYELAFSCFAECSVDFFKWFSEGFWYEIAQMIIHHRELELLYLLDGRLEEMTGNRFTGNIDLIYHVVIKSLKRY